MPEEYVILVDENDNEMGVMEKMKAHREGVLHRAFSVFIFNDKEELLLQQRASNKYHSARLWTNTCCSHPRPNETIKDAAHRRLFEEMGISCDLTIKTNFIYKSPFENGLTEHELDYVLIGKTNKNPQINIEEVKNFKWMSISDIKKQLQSNPENYTIWFKIAMEKLF
ncbi:MAG: isopentenyl-diphosphate delta-isomerase [Bacteroidetes bacterium]|jgi:isopentenyl-diphosphate delta-isomerase|nr:isopentenyl-diphosphate delta-isomerase [Bacteroidota bacterium]MDF2451756.1 isopentenyl-diphosphate delta-isomerase [Bacteroidota bacterium]